jgi:hypothetical protein
MRHALGVGEPRRQAVLSPLDSPYNGLMRIRKQAAFSKLLPQSLHLCEKFRE